MNPRIRRIRVMAGAVLLAVAIIVLCSCRSQSPYITHNGIQTLITPLP